MERRLLPARVDRTVQLGTTAQLQSRATRRISWSALFLKAYGLVAKKFPPLRQAWISWPVPYLYEHPESIAMLAVHRRRGRRDRLGWGRIRAPEHRSLISTQQRIDRLAELPIEKLFRRHASVGRVPGVVRTLVWRTSLHLYGARRARHVGTFSLASLDQRFAVDPAHPTGLATRLTYGPLDELGRSHVRLLYDHRLLDRVHAADVLDCLEETMQRPINAELKALGPSAAGAA